MQLLAGRGAERRTGAGADRRGAVVARDLGLHAGRRGVAHPAVGAAGVGRVRTEHPEVELARRALARQREADVGFAGDDLLVGVPVARADVDEAAVERVDLIARQLPERAGELQPALREGEGRRELRLGQRVGVGDAEGGGARAQLERRIADAERRVLERHAALALRVVPRERRPRRGRVGADARAPEQEPRRPHERDAVAARAGAPRSGVAEGCAEARARRDELGVERPRRAVGGDGEGEAAGNRRDVERPAPGGAAQVGRGVRIAHLDLAARAAHERRHPGRLAVALAHEQPQSPLGARQLRLGCGWPRRGGAAARGVARATGGGNAGERERGERAAEAARGHRRAYMPPGRTLASAAGAPTWAVPIVAASSTVGRR